MDNKVKFGEEVFELSDNYLGIINVFTDALAELKLLEMKYCQKIDTKEYDALAGKIRNIEKAIFQIQNSKKENDIKQVKIYRNKLEDCYTELEAYEPLIEALTYMKGLAYSKWYSNVEMVKPLITTLILSGDITKINWESKEILGFIERCLSFFLRIMNQNKVR